MEKIQRKVDPDRHLITKKTYICGSTFTKYFRPCQNLTEGFKYCIEHCIPEDNNALSNNSWFYDYESENLKWIKKDLGVIFRKHGYAHQVVCEYEMKEGYNPSVGQNWNQDGATVWKRTMTTSTVSSNNMAWELT